MSRRYGSRRRALPDFLIVGAQKAGTTSLFHYLSQSPDVRVPLVKEIHYFDLQYQRGTAWYRTSFPTRHAADDWVTGEASPFYLLHPFAPHRARKTVPDARVICILRDPVARAVSHWKHEVRLGNETLSFEAALEAEEDRTSNDWRRLETDPNFASSAVQRYSYFMRGVYKPQLKRWARNFDSAQTLILESGEFDRNPRAVTDSVCGFLGIRRPDADADYARRNVGSESSVTAEVALALADRYRAANLELFDYLGRSYLWSGVNQQ